jgi:hypothetical protein
LLNLRSHSPYIVPAFKCNQSMWQMIDEINDENKFFHTLFLSHGRERSFVLVRSFGCKVFWLENFVKFFVSSKNFILKKIKNSSKNQNLILNFPTRPWPSSRPIHSFLNNEIFSSLQYFSSPTLLNNVVDDNRLN